MEMKRNRISWIFSVGILGLLGFASCSPRLHSRKAKEVVPDTLAVPRPDTLKKVPGEFAPIKLMYGVPPARYEVMEATNTEDSIPGQRH